MNAVRVLCSPEIAAGFELAGLRPVTATDSVAARAQLAAWAVDPAVGIVLIEDRLHRALPADFVSRLESQPRPLVAPFPGPHFEAAEAAEDRFVEMLRRAIGYRVRLP